jgi:hypothetical protein
VRRFIVAFSCVVATAFAFQNAVAETTSGIAIEGKVLQAPGGQPIRKANVQFSASGGQSNGPYSATTDAEGRFRIDDVKPGRYMVTLEHPGFVQSGRGGRSTSILLQPGQGTTDLVFHMQPAAVITGKIVDLDGDPMKKCRCQCAPGRLYLASIGASMTKPPMIWGNFASPICGQGNIRLRPTHQTESRRHIRWKKTTRRST